MTAALTPELALAYLGELSVDVRAAVVLGADGAARAGDAALVPRARELLATADGGVRTALGDDGTLLVAGTAGGPAIAVLAGPLALLPLLADDLARAAAALA